MTGVAEEEIASQLSLKRLVSLFALGRSWIVNTVTKLKYGILI